MPATWKQLAYKTEVLPDLLSPYVVGDLLYASTTSALSKLADVAVGQVLVSGGVGAAPAWSGIPTVAGIIVVGNVGIGTTGPNALLHLKGTLSSALTGTVSVTINTATVTGVGTAFTTELAVGDSIKIGTEVFTVEAIASATSLTLDSNHLAGASGATAYRDPTLFAIDNGDAVNKLTVTRSGNVGIGTTEPSARLEISGRVSQIGLGYSTFFGYEAGKNDDLTNNYNTAVGYRALYFNTTGHHNFAMGNYALYYNTTGHDNSAMGSYALYSNTTGYDNSAMGVNALYSNTTGYYNSAMGVGVLLSNTDGYDNSAVGVNALYFNTTGYCNSAVGMNALFYNTTGCDNFAMGVDALRSNTTGYHNSAMGTNALYSNTTGSYNSAMGVNAGRYIADGVTANQTSNNSVFLGYDTRANADGETNQIVIGATAIGAGSNSVVLGNNSITKTILKGNVGIGTMSPTNVLSFEGNAARIFWVERHTTADSVGNSLTIQAGGATVAATNKAGGQLILLPGLSTGSAESGITIRGCVAGSAGTGDNSLQDMIKVLGNKLGVFNTTPVVQQNHIADASGGTTVDAEARAAINAALLVLETYGWLKVA